MEKLIIILLILIIFLLLSEKFSLKIERKKYPPLPESKKTLEKPKSSTSIMGKSKFVPPKQENPLTEAEKQAILAEFEQENESNLSDFEEELAQKIVGANLLEEIEKALPEASLKVAQLLDEILPQTPQKESDFDIEEFV